MNTVSMSLIFAAILAATGQEASGQKPDRENVSYGPHERNVFDLWLAKAEGPRPLVIYYHGGGFWAGDKSGLYGPLRDGLLARGISVAAVNYRLTDVGPYPMQMEDCARALQFIRHYADEYGIDPARIGATGNSAGAGISLWLAFHDDLADPDNKDPIARQSTRLSVAVVYGAQSTYDPRVIKELFNTDKVEVCLIPFFGMKSADDVSMPEFSPLFEDSSAITHLTAEDPPVLAYYPQANQPLPPNSTGGEHIHHPKFGFLLKEKMDSVGIECVLVLREQTLHPLPQYLDFFTKHLLDKGTQ